MRDEVTGRGSKNTPLPSISQPFAPTIHDEGYRLKSKKFSLSRYQSPARTDRA
jgi:hypothetical protein